METTRPKFAARKPKRCRSSKAAGWNSRFVKLCAVAAFPIFFPASGVVNAHTVVLNSELKPIPLPTAKGAVILDHLAYDRATKKLWVPACNTGKVDVINEDSDAVSPVSGFKTSEVELEGQKVRLGPTAASIGDGVVYIGNRGDSTLNIIDSQTLDRGESVQVTPVSHRNGPAPHAIAYVAATRELWVTTGPDKSIEVFDASEPRHLKWKMEIPLDGTTEGSAVSNQRGQFYTNIVETGQTLAIDLRSHKVVSKWDLGSTDPKGIALDSGRGFLFVACGDHIVNLDLEHDGKVLDSLVTGAGLDDIDFSTDQKALYAAAAVTATLTIADVSDDGKFHVKNLLPTVKGARGVTAAKGKTAYLIDPAGGRILKMTLK
jgi:DNA-binding beta-propeller fold protein YncE